MKERSTLLLIVGVFLAAYYVPIGNGRVQSAILESFFMLQDYARAHVLTCLVPAFFIAGAIAVLAGHFDLRFALPLAAAEFVGAQIGPRFSLSVDKRHLKRAFGALLPGVAFWMVASALRGL